MEEEKETEPKGSAEPPTRVGGGQWQQGKKKEGENQIVRGTEEKGKRVKGKNGKGK